MAMGKILPIAFWFISRKGENMKFDLNAYEKVFPAKQPTITTDSAVEGYNPTADEANGTAQTKVESAVEVDTTQPETGATIPANSAQPTKMDATPENGINVHEEGTTPLSGDLEP